MCWWNRAKWLSKCFCIFCVSFMIEWMSDHHTFGHVPFLNSRNNNKTSTEPSKCEKFTASTWMTDHSNETCRCCRHSSSNCSNGTTICQLIGNKRKTSIAKTTNRFSYYCWVLLWNSAPLDGVGGGGVQKNSFRIRRIKLGGF